MKDRRFLAPEVVQSSAMDCGPATLNCLLAGFGIRTSLDRLREACQTGVDGTSIDALEDAARLLGLDAVQVMAPVDHVLLDDAELLPAIVLTRLPGGLLHLVVAWRRVGRFVQVMDPAVGRRWIDGRRFTDDLLVHQFGVPEDAFVSWATSPSMLAPLRTRLASLGIAQADIGRLVDAAVGADEWRAVVDLDAATRTATSLVAAGAVSRGTGAAVLVERLATSERDAVLDDHRFATAGPEGEVMMRGAVLVQVTGPSAEPVDVDALPEGVRAALTEPPPRPWAELARRVIAAGRSRIVGIVAAATFATAAVLVEAALLRAVIDGDGTPGGRLAALAVVAAFAAVAAGAHTLAAANLGRRLDGDLRQTLLRRLPLLPDRWIRSRPVSDLAERAHRLHQLRELPGLGADLLRKLLELVAITVAIGVVDRSSAVPAVIALVAAVGAAAGQHPALAERDLRMRSHAGALARFFLDGMLGLIPLRAHSAERAFAGQHDQLLSEWTRAARALARTVVTAEGVQRLVGLAASVWLVWGVRDRAAAEPGTFLLLAYWALTIPYLGDQLGRLARQWPWHRNITLRFLEPLAAPLTEAAAAEPAVDELATGVAISVRDVTALAGGHVILDAVSVDIAAGEHVAILGRSGAGKSSLVGILLGWHQPVAGDVLVDGAPLDAATLRAVTAWVDPAVQLWNDSLAANVTYGSDGSVDDTQLAAAIADAALAPVADELAHRHGGADVALGEGGGLLSGGEGQRVRLARARLRPGVRLALLDEAFRGLDREMRHDLLAQARSWWAGATLLFVTHDVSETRGFARVLVVDSGTIVEDGDPDVLAADPASAYRALLDDEAMARQVLEDGWRRLEVEDGRLYERERRPSEAGR